MESTGIFQFADRTSLLITVFCVQCYSVRSFPTVYFSVDGVTLYNFLNRNDFLDLKVADLVMFLALQQQTAQIRPLKFVLGR